DFTDLFTATLSRFPPPLSVKDLRQIPSGPEDQKRLRVDPFKRGSPAPVGAAGNNPGSEETARPRPGEVTGNRRLVHAEMICQALLFAVRQFTDHCANQ